MEKTIDHVHEALIREVAELDNSVSALQKELNINMANLEDLRTLPSFFFCFLFLFCFWVVVHARACIFKVWESHSCAGSLAQHGL